MSDHITEQAARWHAIQDGDAMDWDAFTSWLEADPRHRVAFDDIALIDERISRHRDALRSSSSSVRSLATDRIVAARERPARWRWPAAAAVAAALAVGVFTLQQPSRDRSPVEYRATVSTRSIDLGGGARVALAPGSVLVADNTEGHRLKLSGRALFDVDHNPARELVVRAEGYEIRDVGTRFDVVTGTGQMRVAVAEGRVAIKSRLGSEEVELGAGHALTGYADGTMTTATIGAKQVGGWRQPGPLLYDRVPLGLVAADVARASGRPVEVDAAVRSRPFSGVLTPARGDTMAEALAASAGLQARRDGETIRLGDGAPR
ncbi:DUF4880 domain-containing protein [Sphingomonas sp. MA1305]|jgi:transmembrane sensor|uniref:FecR family protein n=1 Tax=unclassified Sphingomonas TaxID=196159 RepID=UPI0018DF495A|nr:MULTISPECIES: FecR domain-containing protein [unclassified Sphingomonas]MBI0476995.1 DUF4880 domain-containing protein [Sphingomonas sp. MA1305]MCP4025505.1 DUF4880 domain-containing protein [Sphingomonas sp.]